MFPLLPFQPIYQEHSGSFKNRGGRAAVAGPLIIAGNTPISEERSSRHLLLHCDGVRARLEGRPQVAQRHLARYVLRGGKAPCRPALKHLHADPGQTNQLLGVTTNRQTQLAKRGRFASWRQQVAKASPTKGHSPELFLKAEQIEL